MAPTVANVWAPKNPSGDDFALKPRLLGRALAYILTWDGDRWKAVPALSPNKFVRGILTDFGFMGHHKKEDAVEIGTVKFGCAVRTYTWMCSARHLNGMYLQWWKLYYINVFKIVIYFFSVNYRANSTSKYVYIYIAFMQQPFHAGFWIGRDDPLSELLHDVKANKKGE